MLDKSKKHMLFTGWEVRIVKNCDQGLEKDSRPRSQFLRLFLRMQNESLGMCGELKRSIFPIFGRSDVNEGPLTDVWQTYM